MMIRQRISQQNGFATILVLVAVILLATLAGRSLFDQRRSQTQIYRENTQANFDSVANRLRLVFDPVDLCTCNVRGIQLNQTAIDTSGNAVLGAELRSTAGGRRFGFHSLPSCVAPDSNNTVLSVDTQLGPTFVPPSPNRILADIVRFENFNFRSSVNGERRYQGQLNFVYNPDGNIGNTSTIRNIASKSSQKSPISLDILVGVNPDGSINRCYASTTPKSCDPSTVNLCSLDQTPHGGNSGTCQGQGLCNYSCNDGNWVPNNNNCAPAQACTDLSNPACRDEEEVVEDVNVGCPSCTNCVYNIDLTALPSFQRVPGTKVSFAKIEEGSFNGAQHCGVHQSDTTFPSDLSPLFSGFVGSGGCGAGSGSWRFDKDTNSSGLYSYCVNSKSICDYSIRLDFQNNRLEVKNIEKYKGNSLCTRSDIRKLRLKYYRPK